MPMSVSQRVRKRRDALRAAGLRPIQIWVPDTRQTGFADECRRQAALVAAADATDPDLSDFMDAALADLRRGRGVKRGDLVTVAMSGEFGKPRPAFVIQSDRFEGTGTLTVLLVAGTEVDAPLIRVAIDPTPESGLRKPSQVMIDKAMSVKREKIGPCFGGLDDERMPAVTRSLAIFLGPA